MAVVYLEHYRAKTQTRKPDLERPVSQAAKDKIADYATNGHVSYLSNIEVRLKCIEKLSIVLFDALRNGDVGQIAALACSIGRDSKEAIIMLQDAMHGDAAIAESGETQDGNEQ